MLVYRYKSWFKWFGESVESKFLLTSKWDKSELFSVQDEIMKNSTIKFVKPVTQS